ncbi:hypothetical protein quinque_009885 [Culex quinquefasciatus]
MVKTTNGETPSKKGLKMVLKKFREHTKNPEIFLSAQTARAEKIKSLVKSLYDHGQLVELTGTDKRRNAAFLDELIVDEMDEEQIWQQLELKNEQLLGQDLPATSKLLSMGSKRLQLAFREEGDGEDLGGEDEEEDQDMDGEASGSEDEDEEVPVQKQNGKGKTTKKGKKAKRSIVDDKFFRLDDMAKFLDEEDQREMRRQEGKPDVDPLIEIDYFSADVGEDEDDSDEEDLKYSDFFDDDEEGDSDNEEQDDEQDEDGEQDQEMEDESGSEAEEGKPESEEELNSEDEVERNRRLRFELYNASGDFLPGSTSKKVPIERPESSESEAEQKSDAEEEESAEKEERKRDDGPKSSFELRQEKLQQRIEKMENQLLDAKPWQLKGEISADTRPQNSLLEEVLEFESTTRPAPVITEETTMRLEDIIRQRVKNKAWDDVERKVRPPDNPREYRKQLVLDGEKSKESLAQIYERDYLKQLEKANPDAADQDASEEESKEHRQIRAAMKTLLAQLDALSNFHYTPRPAVPELKIITNTPAINMEEVAPVATSDATLLAPEEVHNRPKGDVMSKDERARADKNRERRLKKRFQREKFERQAEKEQKLLEKGIKPKGKEQQEKLLKKVAKAKNVSTMVEGKGATSKSSTAFFSQLQDEVSTQIKGKLAGQKKAKKNGGAAGLQATHVKL